MIYCCEMNSATELHFHLILCLQPCSQVHAFSGEKNLEKKVFFLILSEVAAYFITQNKCNIYGFIGPVLSSAGPNVLKKGALWSNSLPLTTQIDVHE